MSVCVKQVMIKVMSYINTILRKQLNYKSLERSLIISPYQWLEMMVVAMNREVMTKMMKMRMVSPRRMTLISMISELE